MDVHIVILSGKTGNIGAYVLGVYTDEAAAERVMQQCWNNEGVVANVITRPVIGYGGDLA